MKIFNFIASFFGFNKTEIIGGIIHIEKDIAVTKPVENIKVSFDVVQQIPAKPSKLSVNEIKESFGIVQTLDKCISIQKNTNTDNTADLFVTTLCEKFLDVTLTKQQHNIATNVLYGDNMVVQGIRVSGKTTCMLNSAIIKSLKHDNSTTFILCVDRYMAERIFDIVESNRLLRNLIDNISKSESHIKFVNGSSIRFITSGRLNDNIRGHKVDLLLVDEYAYYTTDVDLSISFAKQIVVFSTRKNTSKKNKFWKLWVDAVDGKNRFVPHVLNKRFGSVGDIKKSMSRSRYDTENTIKYGPKKIKV